MQTFHCKKRLHFFVECENVSIIHIRKDIKKNWQILNVNLQKQAQSLMLQKNYAFYYLIHQAIIIKSQNFEAAKAFKAFKVILQLHASQKNILFYTSTVPP